MVTTKGASSEFALLCLPVELSHYIIYLYLKILT